MLRATCSLLVCATLCFVAETHAATWTVPGMSNAPGRNATFFASELRLRNPGSNPAQATFALLPYVGAPVAQVSKTIAAGETLVLPNVLKDLWGEGDRAGALRVTSAENLFISARTYNNADPSGTFGLGLESVPDEKLLGAGETGHIGWISESPDSSTGFRTNIGIILLTAGSSVDAIVFGSNGAELGRRTFAGGPITTQVSIRDIASGDLSVARLELRVSTGKVTGYSAVVDNVTGDGFAVQPQRITPGSWADLFLNGASRGPGRFETFFKTDARIVNPSAVARTVAVSGVSLVAAGQPFPASGTVELPARGVVELNDIMGSLLKAPEGTSGSLRFETDGPLLVLGRTSNVRADGSTFGSVQRTTEANTYLRLGINGTFIGLNQSSQAPGYRTNIGFLSGPAGSVLDLNLRDRAGVVVATRTAAVVLGAYVYWQPSLADLFPGSAIPENATLEVIPQDGTVDVYAAVIDNGTGDPAIYPYALPALTQPAVFSATSPCEPQIGAGGGAPEGTTLSRVDIDLARYPDAVCNDGTNGLFFVRRGVGASANRWIIYLEGGGTCFTGTSCANRWCSIETSFGANLMSNRFAPVKGTERGGILATRADNAFSDFTRVWVYYCSSDAWSGRAGNKLLIDETGRLYTIHFQGSRILDAVISELRAGVTYKDAATGQSVSLPGLDDAEVLILSGESAGSAGVQKNVDRLAPYLKRTNRNPDRFVFRSIMDAANDPSNESFSLYESSKRNSLRAFSVVVSGRQDESCFAMHVDDYWRCGDAAHVRENHITQPFFVRQDLIDPNTLDNFGTPEWPFGSKLSLYAQATWDHLDRLSRIRTTAEEKDAMKVDPGLYGPHCDQHTALRNNSHFFVDKISMGGDLLSYHDVLRNWMIQAQPRVVMQPRPTQDSVPRSAVCTE